MTLFRLRWLRIFIRRNTKPIPVNKAVLWSRRLSIIYAVTSWHAFGFVMYMVYTGKSDWAKLYNLKSEEELRLSPAQQWTKTLGIKDATVYRVSGFKVSKYEVHNEFDDNEKPKSTFFTRQTKENEAQPSSLQSNT